MNGNKIDFKYMHERDLHPFLIYFLHKKMNIYAKTIYHEVSTKMGKGENQWLHPDIVGFNLPVEDLNEKVLELCGKFSINRATIYSFELKKSITTETLREQFFQAVSNSSWANEGYLVGVDIDTENAELMKEINRLSTAFDIGVIKLNLFNPELSEILVHSRRKKNLDAETMNKLFNINSNFREFIDTVLKSININQVVNTNLDEVLKEDDLKLIIKEFTNKKTNLPKEEKITLIQDIDLKYYTLNTKFIGKSPKMLNIKNNIIEVKTWRDVYICICEHLIEEDREKFIAACSVIKGTKRLYFSNIKEEIKQAHHFNDIDIYIEMNLSADNIVGNIRKLLSYYNIDESDILIGIKEI